MDTRPSAICTWHLPTRSDHTADRVAARMSEVLGVFRFPSRPGVARLLRVRTEGHIVLVETAAGASEAKPAASRPLPVAIAHTVADAVLSAREDWGRPEAVLACIASGTIQVGPQGAVRVDGLGIWTAAWAAAHAGDLTHPHPVPFHPGLGPAGEALDVAMVSLWSARHLFGTLLGAPDDPEGMRAFLQSHTASDQAARRRTEATRAARAMFAASPGLAGLLEAVPGSDGDVTDDVSGLAVGRIDRLWSSPAHQALLATLIAGLSPAPTERPSLAGLLDALGDAASHGVQFGAPRPAVTTPTPTLRKSTPRWWPQPHPVEVTLEAPLEAP